MGLQSQRRNLESEDARYEAEMSRNPFGESIEIPEREEGIAAAGNVRIPEDVPEDDVRDILAAGDVVIGSKPKPKPAPTRRRPPRETDPTPIPPQPSLLRRALPWVLAAAGLGSTVGLLLNRGGGSDTDTQYELRLFDAKGGD